MVIAFIPVRGGSKSIPLKNIRLFCGKPLVCWSIEALEACTEVDEIIVATDSDEIANVVSNHDYYKTHIYRRSAENASDTASTESVMLEYLHYAKPDQDSVFMLVQATSPLTETVHFSEALNMYAQGGFDSILTCVRSHRFFWNEDGSSLNYDYKKRPRRQDFQGIMMENGAFYINTVNNVIKNSNRLCGKIGIYEMPDYTALELDEPEDWRQMEYLMRKNLLSGKTGFQKRIRLFLSDVDGTLTDGGMYYSESGDELKRFDTRDGMGFKLLREAGIKVGIITGEETAIVEQRAKKLKVDYLYQGCGINKLAAAKEICQKMGITLNEVAYIGDDINCIDLLSNVGLAACPADANEKVKNVPNVVTLTHPGGRACVREFIDQIITLPATPSRQQSICL